MTRQMVKLLVLVSLLSGLAGAALAVFRPWEPSLIVTSVYALPLSDQGNMAEVFLDIQNPNGAPDRLLDVRAVQAKDASVVPAAWSHIPVPAHSQISLAPDSAHIRLIEMPPAQMANGALIPLELMFERAGRVQVKARMSMAGSTKALSDGEEGLFGMADICVVAGGEPAPEISLSMIRNDLGYLVKVESDAFEFTPHLLNSDHIPGTGHGHVYIDGGKLGRLFQNTIQIGELPPGEHLVRVTLNTNDHRLYLVDDEPVEAVMAIKVGEN